MKSLNKLTLAALIALSTGLLVQPAVHADDDTTTGAVTGTLVDQQGNPVAGVAVQVIAPAPPPTGMSVNGISINGMSATAQPLERGGDDGGALGSATSDANGQFTISKLPPGRLRVIAGSQQNGMASTWVTVQAGKTTTIRMKILKRPEF